MEGKSHMKRRMLVVATMTLLAVTFFARPAFARIDGTYTSGTSPTNITIYYQDRWSPYGYVDLRTASFIPTGATVDYGITVTWTVSRSGYYGMQVYLYNGSGVGVLVPYSGSNVTAFNGQPAKQNWSVRFMVDTWNYPGQPLSITPKVTMNWQNP